MPLSQDEKDRIVEEENLRLETRMKAHQGFANKGVGCGTCGHKPGCSGCRVWAVLLGLLVVFVLFRSFACSHEDRCRFYGYGAGGRMGAWNPPQNAPNPGTAPQPRNP